MEAWKVVSRRAALCLTLAALLVPPPVAEAQGRPRRPPVVVELFTAQGCASCPQANQILAGLADDDRVLALTFPVDYWDYLGWRDTFAKPEFTVRQRAYVMRLRLKEIYTPEMVVGGRRETPAIDRDRVAALVAAERASSRRPEPAIGFTRRGKRVMVGSGAAPSGGGEVWLVRYDPMRRDVRVRFGENAGRVVTHVNVVKELTLLGEWTGRSKIYAAPEPSSPGLKTVVLVQGSDGGPLIAVGQS